MADDTLTRKLATIVALDVAGYSARTEADEARTTSEVAALRKVIEGIAGKHGGRVFNTAGDGFMLEFGSSLAAVEAAFELAGTCEPKVRVGVHLGDVAVQPNGDLLGHGVNVAARLMARSEPGGALVSGAVRSSIRGSIAERLQSRGHLTLDKMTETIEAFALSDAGVAPAKSDSAKKVSICVLPFSNISDDPQQEYFSDGISEDIITDLSKVSALGVTARNTSFQFKGKSVDVPAIARKLRVSHVLEGSVRKAGGRVRITAQLIDGASGEHVWAERYDRDLSDIFALQDEISQAIVKALRVRLLPEEKKAIEARGTTNLKAYNCYLLARALSVHLLAATQRFASVLRLCDAAIKLDPNYARAWALMALTQALRTTFLYGEPGDGLDAADRAIELDPALADGHMAKARVLFNLKGPQAAHEEIEIALKISPEDGGVLSWAGVIYLFSGKETLAIACWKKAAEAERANFWTFRLLSMAYRMIGDAESARQAAERVIPLARAALVVQPDSGLAIGALTEAYAVVGDKERVRENAEYAALLDPDNAVMNACIVSAFVMIGEIESALDALERALRRPSKQFPVLFKTRAIVGALRGNPRFEALIADAEARLARTN